MHRPTSVLWASIVLLALGGLGLLGDAIWFVLKDDPDFIAVTAKMPPTIPLDFILGAIGALVCIASGIGFLLRQGWMRYLLAIWAILLQCYSAYRGHMTVLALARDIVIYGGILWFMFQPRARTWFETVPPISST